MIYCFPDIKGGFILFRDFFFFSYWNDDIIFTESLSSYGDLWERSLGGNGYMYVYDWVPLLFIWNCHNIVC